MIPHDPGVGFVKVAFHAYCVYALTSKRLKICRYFRYFRGRKTSWMNTNVDITLFSETIRRRHCFIDHCGSHKIYADENSEFNTLWVFIFL